MGDGDEIFFGRSWRHAHTDLNNMADYHEWLTLIGQIYNHEFKYSTDSKYLYFCKKFWQL